MIGAVDRKLRARSTVSTTAPKAIAVRVLDGCVMIGRVTLPSVVRPKVGPTTARAGRIHAEPGVEGCRIGPVGITIIIVSDLVPRVDLAAERRVCQLAVVVT